MQFYTTMGGERLSLGAICVRKTAKYEAVMVRNRFTYALNYIIHGRYDPKSDEELIRLLSGTTVDEKHDMLSLEFNRIWYRVWINAVRPTGSYYIGKRRFDATFVMDGGARLRSLIARSTSAQLLWEFPKGKKKHKSESDLKCAMREFGEETGMRRGDYKLYPEAQCKHVYVDEGIRYTNVYYFAFSRPGVELGVSFNTDQHTEISDIQWMDIDMIRKFAPHYERSFRSAVNYCKRRNKLTH